MNSSKINPAELGAWIPAAERLPPSGHPVLAAYLNAHGEWCIIRAKWVAAWSVPSGFDSEIGEYLESDDTFYDPEGWYEAINNWEDYSAVRVYEGSPSHWTELPHHPMEDCP